MKLPYITQSAALYLDPGSKFVTYNYAGTSPLQTSAVLNRVTEQVATQPTASAQPVWSSTAIAGKYVAQNKLMRQWSSVSRMCLVESRA